MVLVQRYVLRRLAVAFLTAIVALAAVVWVTRALRDLNVVTAKGQTLLIFLEVTSLALPTLVVVIAPFAVLMAAIFVLNALNSESESVVIAASGGSRAMILTPVMVLAVIVGLGMAAMTTWGLPVIQQKLRAAMLAINVDLVANIVQPGRFVQLDEALTFHIRNRAGDGSLVGLMIDDRREPAETKTYLAKEAVMVEAGATTVLVMKDGTLLRANTANGAQTSFVFDTYGFDLSDLSPQADKQDPRPSERSTLELARPDLSDAYVTRNLPRFRSELHDRLSQPLLPVALALIAYLFLGDARTTRQNKAVAIGGAVLASLLLRGLMMGAVSASASFGGALLLYGAPLSVIVLATIQILRDRQLGLAEPLEACWDAIAALFAPLVGLVLRRRRAGWENDA